MELETRLLSVIRSEVGAGKAYVCFSGGVDSTLVLAACIRAGVDTTGLLGVSPSLPRVERAHAHRLAAEIGAPIQEVKTREMDVEAYRANTGDRCYHCKSTLFQTISELAAARAEKGVLLTGTQLDDLGDYRPGLRAGEENNVLTPLVTAGFHKTDVRQLAREWSLSNADKPAAPCLASRLPVGTEVSPERLSQIETVEDFLRIHGIWPARARWHGPVVRLEIPESLFSRVLAEPFKGQLHAVCSGVGFRFVALDIFGLQSGSLSRPLETV